MLLLQRVAPFVLLSALAQGFRVRKQAPKDGKAQHAQVDLPAQVRSHMETLPQTGISSDIFECRLSESDCKIGDMRGPTIVYTDSDDSRCMSGEPWAFAVNPGKTSKLYFYFPGGGACWRGVLSSDGTCFQTLGEGLAATGFGTGATEDRADNPLGDYTFVSPAYCDGGAYITNGTLGDKPQTGARNVQFAVDWAKSNMDQKLEYFVSAGSSAGALGTMAWSRYLLDTFAYTKASVFVDSYAAVFPSGTMGPVIKDFGACTTNVFAPIRDLCDKEQANIHEMFKDAMQRNPDVAFAMYQSKEDAVQTAFYSIVALTFFRIEILRGPDLYYWSNVIKEYFNEEPNFVSFYINGEDHVFFPFPWWYDTTIAGGAVPPAPARASGGVTLRDWTADIIDHKPAQSLCDGPLEFNRGYSIIFPTTNYCYDALYPKTLRVAR